MRLESDRLRSWRFPLLVGGLVLAIATPLGAQQPTGALVVSGPAPEFFLLYTGDVIGYLEPCG